LATTAGANWNNNSCQGMTPLHHAIDQSEWSRRAVLAALALIPITDSSSRKTVGATPAEEVGGSWGNAVALACHLK